jgi:hypothetical protein
MKNPSAHPEVASTYRFCTPVLTSSMYMMALYVAKAYGGRSCMVHTHDSWCTVDKILQVKLTEVHIDQAPALAHVCTANQQYHAIVEKDVTGVRRQVRSRWPF